MFMYEPVKPVSAKDTKNKICYSTIETPHHKLSCKPFDFVVLVGSISDEKEDDQVVEMHMIST